MLFKSLYTWLTAQWKGNITQTKTLYLGIILDDNLNDELDLKRHENSLHRRGNVFVSHFKDCSTEVKDYLFKTMCSEESSYTLSCSLSIPLKIPWSRLLFRGAISKTLWLITNGQKHYTRVMSRSMTCISTCTFWGIARIYYQCATFLFYLILSVPMDTLCFKIKICYVMLSSIISKVS